MDIIKSKVFAKLGNHGCILAIDGGYTSSNITDPENWVQIDAGAGDRYNLCQTCYLPDGYLTQDRIPLYRWDGSRVIPRTDAEIQADREALPQAPPAPMEQLRADVDFLAVMGGVEL